MTSFNFNYLLKDPISTATLGVRAPTYEFLWGHNSVYKTEDSHLFFYSVCDEP